MKFIFIFLITFIVYSQNKKQEKNPNTLDAIVVVGSKVKKSVKEKSIFSLEYFDTSHLDSSKYINFGEQLQSILPSFHIAKSYISDGTDAVHPITLRGLSPDQTLVLINGKRRHTSALLHVNGSIGRGTSGVDFNTFASNGIENIQFLKSGASSLYGTDAIAGVVNINLKESLEGKFSIYQGISSKDDGETSKISLSDGFSYKSGFISYAYEFINKGYTNRGGLIGARNYPDQTDGSFDPREEDFDRTSMKVGEPKLDQHSLLINSKTFLDDSSHIYSFATFSQRTTENNGFYRLAKDPTRNVPEVYPDGFLPFILSTVDDSSFAIGYAKEFLNKWNMDLSYIYSHNKFRFRVINSINASHAQSLLDDGQSIEQVQANTPREADSGALELNTHTVNLDFTKKDDLNNMTLSTGIEFRRQHYLIHAGEELSYTDYDGIGVGKTGGIQVFPGFSPENEVDKTRDNLGAYAQLEKELNKKVLLSSSIRLENYDNFGTTVVGNLSTKYEINKQLSLRLSLNTGFRAPSIQQEFFNATSTSSGPNGELIQTGTFTNDSEVARAFGIPSLKEEKSHSFNFNTNYRASESLSISFDAYYINISDRIALSNNIEANSSTNSEFNSVFTNHDIGGAQFFLNLGNTQTTGTDFTIHYKKEINKALFNSRLSFSWHNTIVSEINDSPGLLSGINLISDTDISIIEDWDPNILITLKNSYSINRYTYGLDFEYYGPYTINDGGIQEYSGELLTNINFEYQFNDKFSFTLGVNNLFNIYPDENEIGNARGGTIDGIVDSPGVFTYSRRNLPFGNKGTFVFANLNYFF